MEPGHRFQIADTASQPKKHKRRLSKMEGLRLIRERFICKSKIQVPEKLWKRSWQSLLSPCGTYAPAMEIRGISAPDLLLLY